MPTSYNDQGYPVDIFVVNVGDVLSVVPITLVDIDDNGFIQPGDTINGFTVTNAYVGDTVTVDGNLITGVTFTTTGGPFFTPNDGSFLVGGTVDATTFVSNSTSMPVSTLAPPCFVKGTLIETPFGRIPVEDLKAGDLVATRDHGDQPLIWVGTARTHGNARFAPVRFEIGALDNAEVLELSQQHRILIQSPEAELNFGTDEVLVAAKHLAGRPGVKITSRATVDYVHIMCAQHEVICSNGVWSESYFYGSQEVSGLENAARRELEEIFANDDAMVANFSQTARVCLKAHEAALLAH